MARTLLPGQRSLLRIHDVATGEAVTVHESRTTLFEAPNWTPDGSALVANADGALARLPLTGSGAGRPEWIDLTGVPEELNNDHVLAPEGDRAYVSARDGHLYAVRLDGSAPAERLTRPVPVPDGGVAKHYLHGVSPDGGLLALILGTGDGRGGWRTDVCTLPVSGGPLTRLTDDDPADDGVEVDADGEWLLFNSERREAGESASPGHAQLFRMRLDGSDLRREVVSDRVDWFPHASPDGRFVLYLSYPAGTLGHPENLPVELRLIDRESRPAGSTEPGRVIRRLLGGQGTINVAGWAPDSSRFAFAEYPLD